MLPLEILAAGTSVYIENRQTEELAENFLRDSRSLQPGKSTEEDVKRIVERYSRGSGIASGFCGDSRNDKYYSVKMTNPDLESLGRINRFLRPFGNRSWWVSGVFVVQHGQLCASLYSFYARAPDPHYAIYDRLTYQEKVHSFYNSDYSVIARDYKNLHIVDAKINTDSTPIAQQRAFDFDLRCLRRLGGCKAGCEVMPSVWVDAKKRAQSEHLVLPPDEDWDAECAKVGE